MLPMTDLSVFSSLFFFILVRCFVAAYMANKVVYIKLAYFSFTVPLVADYPLGRIGSCLRPGMVGGPGPFKEKQEKRFIKTCF